SSDPWKSSIAVASATHVGMRRRNNQDNHSIHLAEDESAWNKFGHLLIVADGMGAHAAGELASQLSVELIPHHYRKLFRGGHAEALQLALAETNAEIFRRGQANPEFRSMGTTTCALAIVPEGAIVAHVGDSRVYRMRGTQLEQLTFDHSLVWEMRASGDLSEEAIKNSNIPKNVITRSLGPNASVMVDIEGPYPLKVGDKFLLCSDGLSGQITDEEIGNLLQLLDIQTAVQAMIDLANLRGGPDNITVVVCEITSDRMVNPSEATSSKNVGSATYPLPFGIVAAICLLLSLILLILGQFPIALIALAAAVVAFVTGWLKYRDSSSSGLKIRGQHGKGPYRRIQCKPDSRFVNELVGVIQELESWFQENKWPIDSDQLSSLREKARSAEAAMDYSDAIRGHVQAILQMMAEARRFQQDTGQADNDAIEY
ncbi:MAG: serine/threonine-protein phosphatase, partial [Planctomycetes bacterium]|nr:serine/threonine-protein phosphatase [Planctomycetota bacterium]